VLYDLPQYKMLKRDPGRKYILQLVRPEAGSGKEEAQKKAA